MSDFEVRVYPVVAKVARAAFTDDQLVQDVIGICWYRYQRNPRSKDIDAKQLAHMAVRKIRSKERIPGERSRGPDALDRGCVHGAGMQHVMDRSPGPDALAEASEEWELLFRVLAEQNMLDLARLGLAADDQRFQRSRRAGGAPSGALPWRLEQKLRRTWRALCRGARPLEILALVQRGMELMTTAGTRLAA